MRVLVAYASRHGSTAEIAERIALALDKAGLSADARPAQDVDDIDAYDAFVIGGAAYLYHWLKDATRFAKRHARQFGDRPVWLFSSGPLGTAQLDEQGRDVTETARPKEFEELRRLLRPRGEQVFFGAWDPESPTVGLSERLVRAMPASREALPAGDFRDWPAIEAWAAEIAATLENEAEGETPSAR